jgi:predicted GNAT family N-acyltransferase
MVRRLIFQERREIVKYAVHGGSFMEMRVIGIDLGKSVFHLVGMDQHGKVVARKRLSRSQMMVYTAKIPPCLIGMEASFDGAGTRRQAHAGTVCEAIPEVQQERLS